MKNIELEKNAKELAFGRNKVALLRKSSPNQIAAMFTKNLGFRSVHHLLSGMGPIGLIPIFVIVSFFLMANPAISAEQQAEAARISPERALEVWSKLQTDFNEAQKTMFKASVARNEQGTISVSEDPNTGEAVVSIRLDVDDKSYNDWKSRALETISTVARKTIVLSSEKNTGDIRLVGGVYFRFDRAASNRIRNWESEDQPPDPPLAVRVFFLTQTGSPVSKTIPLSEFYRRSGDGFAFPLYEMNRLKDLPKSRFPWRGDESAYAELAVSDLTPADIRRASVRCSVFMDRSSDGMAPNVQKQDSDGNGTTKPYFANNALPDVVVPKWDFPFTREDVIRQMIGDMVQIPRTKFLIGKFEVTQIQWAAVMGIESFAPKNNYAQPRVWEGYWCPYDPAKTIEHPVSNMTYHQCLDFLNALNADPIVSESGLLFALPSNEEWTIACLAGGRGMFGKRADGRSTTESNFNETEWISDNHPHPVGLKPANAFGLHDMHGNVREWTKKGHIRGGSWSCFSPSACSVHRIEEPSGGAFLDVGFRLAATVSAQAGKKQTQLGAANAPTKVRSVVRSKDGQAPINYREPTRRWIDRTFHLGPNVDLVVRQTPDGLWFGKYPITQAQWNAVMGKSNNQGRGLVSNLPAERISWDDCFRFLEKLNKMTSIQSSGFVFRLPTMEEWQKACRAGAPETADFAILPDGTPGDMDRMGWNTFNCPQDRPAGPQPVGLKMPNAWGLYDMYGNVSEWTSTTSAVHEVRTQFPSDEKDPLAVSEPYGDFVRYYRYIPLKNQQSYAAASSWLWGAWRNEHFYAARNWSVPIYGFWGTGVFHEYADPDDDFKVYVYRDGHYHPTKRNRYGTGKDTDPFYWQYHCCGMGLRICAETAKKPENQQTIPPFRSF